MFLVLSFFGSATGFQKARDVSQHRFRYFVAQRNLKFLEPREFRPTETVEDAATELLGRAFVWHVFPRNHLGVQRIGEIELAAVNFRLFDYFGCLAQNFERRVASGVGAIHPRKLQHVANVVCDLAMRARAIRADVPLGATERLRIETVAFHELRVRTTKPAPGSRFSKPLLSRPLLRCYKFNVGARLG